MDKLMLVDIGGEVGKFIKKYKSKSIKCFGVCREDRVMNEFRGYPHSSGLTDAKGNKWWVYFECPKCKYGHSFAKMNFFIENTKI